MTEVRGQRKKTEDRRLMSEVGRKGRGIRDQKPDERDKIMQTSDIPFGQS
jgi:hypothetical protein